MSARSRRRGCTGFPCSSTVTGTPASASRSAAHEPAGPEPTTTTFGGGRPAGQRGVDRGAGSRAATSPRRAATIRKR